MPLIPEIFAPVAVGSPRLLSRLYAISRLLDEIEAPRNIIEIGPGLGDLPAHFLLRFPDSRILLSEISTDAARLLQTRFQAEPRVMVSSENILFQAGEPAQRFDLAVACEVFEHLEHDVAGLQSIARLLANGGYFIFSAPCHMKKWQPADVFAGHFRRYERAELESKFTAAGFEILRHWTFGFPSFNLLQPARSLYYRSQNRFKSSHRDKQTATERSGIDRPPLLRAARSLVIAGMLPLLPIERHFWKSDRGDGYLILARKKAA
jgi:SAM-dependent methyltransferase